MRLNSNLGARAASGSAGAARTEKGGLASTSKTKATPIGVFWGTRQLSLDAYACNSLLWSISHCPPFADHRSVDELLSFIEGPKATKSKKKDKGAKSQPAGEPKSKTEKKAAAAAAPRPVQTESADSATKAKPQPESLPVADKSDQYSTKAGLSSQEQASAEKKVGHFSLPS